MPSDGAVMGTACSLAGVTGRGWHGLPLPFTLRHHVAQYPLLPVGLVVPLSLALTHFSLVTFCIFPTHTLFFLSLPLTQLSFLYFSFSLALLLVFQFVLLFSLLLPRSCLLSLCLLLNPLQTDYWRNPSGSGWLSLNALHSIAEELNLWTSSSSSSSIPCDISGLAKSIAQRPGTIKFFATKMEQYPVWWDIRNGNFLFYVKWVKWIPSFMWFCSFDSLFGGNTLTMKPTSWSWWFIH